MDYYTADGRNVERARVFIKLWLMETGNSTAKAAPAPFPHRKIHVEMYGSGRS